MKTFCYLSLIPEALIASSLDPEAFALYYATGSQRRSRSQAIFFEVNLEALEELFPTEEIRNRGMTHQDGSPRKSLYLGVYRVLERVPFDAIRHLHLATPDGKLLTLDASHWSPEASAVEQKRLYQELAPVTPMVASTLEPVAFGKSVTDPARAVFLPRLVYCDLELGALARDSTSSDIEDLPYPNIGHLRDCLIELDHKTAKANKTVLRGMRAELLYRTVKNGFFIIDSQRTAFYALPSRETLEHEHYAWWRSAQKVF